LIFRRILQRVGQVIGDDLANAILVGVDQQAGPLRQLQRDVAARPRGALLLCGLAHDGQQVAAFAAHFQLACVDA